jgi:hypothetical protein
MERDVEIVLRLADCTIGEISLEAEGDRIAHVEMVKQCVVFSSVKVTACKCRSKQ